MKGGRLGLIDSLVDSGGSLLTRGRVGTESLLTGIEEGGQPTPNRRHRSPVVLGGGCWVSIGSLLTGGDRVEARSLLVGGNQLETGTLLTGVEEGGQLMPSKRHRLPVVLEGGG